MDYVGSIELCTCVLKSKLAPKYHLTLYLLRDIFCCYAEVNQIVLRAHLINSCNAPVEWLQGVFAWAIDSFLRKHWRSIARCSMVGRRMGNNLLRNSGAGVPPG